MHHLGRGDIDPDLAHVLVGDVYVAEFPVPAFPEIATANRCPTGRAPRQLRAGVVLDVRDRVGKSRGSRIGRTTEAHRRSGGTPAVAPYVVLDLQRRRTIVDVIVPA